MYQLEPARRGAQRIVDLLQPHCILIDIAGSIRRGKPEVKDIEIVCLPQKIIRSADLFGTATSTQVVPGFAEVIKSISEKVIKGNVEGRLMQIETKDGITLDLFLPQSTDYYRQLAIRTGSADYARHVIASGWKRLGWVGTEDGLRRKTQCQQKVKEGPWKCIVQDPVKPPHWHSEKAFFEWLQIEYVHPSDREIKSPERV